MRWYAAFTQLLEQSDVDDIAGMWNADETGYPLCPKPSRVLILAGTKNVYQAATDTKQQIATVEFLLQGMLFQQCTYFQARDFGITHSRVVSVELTLANLKRAGLPHYSFMAG